MAATPSRKDQIEQGGLVMLPKPVPAPAAPAATPPEELGSTPAGEGDLATLDGMTIEDLCTVLRLLGFDSDGERVLAGDGSAYEDPFVGGPVLLANMAILPNPWVVIDYNPVSINGYLASREV